jgi:hypothetical protein
MKRNPAKRTNTHQVLILLGALFLALSPGAARASMLVYANATTDLNYGLDLVGFQDGVGDSIVLDNNSGPVGSAQLQLYNAGSSGTLDVTLQFFQVGAPVGLQIGSDYTVTGVNFDAASLFLVDFSLGGLTLPDNVVFMVSVANVGSGVAPQLEFYGPSPAVGTNTADQAVVYRTGAYSVEDVSGVGGGNPYLVLTAAPEPGEWILMGSGLLGLLAYARRRRSH